MRSLYVKPSCCIKNTAQWPGIVFAQTGQIGLGRFDIQAGSENCPLDFPGEADTVDMRISQNNSTSYDLDVVLGSEVLVTIPLSLNQSTGALEGSFNCSSCALDSTETGGCSFDGTLFVTLIPVGPGDAYDGTIRPVGTLSSFDNCQATGSVNCEFEFSATRL